MRRSVLAAVVAAASFIPSSAFAVETVPLENCLYGSSNPTLTEVYLVYESSANCDATAGTFVLRGRQTPIAARGEVSSLATFSTAYALSAPVSRLTLASTLDVTGTAIANRLPLGSASILGTIEIEARHMECPACHVLVRREMFNTDAGLGSHSGSRFVTTLVMTNGGPPGAAIPAGIVNVWVTAAIGSYASTGSSAEYEVSGRVVRLTANPIA